GGDRAPPRGDPRRGGGEPLRRRGDRRGGGEAVPGPAAAAAPARPGAPGDGAGGVPLLRGGARRGARSAQRRRLRRRPRRGPPRDGGSGGTMSLASTLAPGARVVIRDEEWMVRRVDAAGDASAVSVVGLSELVRNVEATFLTHLD